MTSDPQLQSRTHANGRPAGEGGTLVNLLENAFCQFIDRTSIDDNTQQISYRQLDAVTRQIAQTIHSRFSVEDLKTRPIAILLPRSAELYIAQVAILRAVGFFVAIDPSTPAERIDYLIQDSKALLVLCGVDDDVKKSSTSTLSIDLQSLLKAAAADQADVSSPSNQEVAVAGGAGPEDLAYLVYTSGSTGRPKGVAVSHGSIANHNHWCVEAYQKTAGDRCLQFTSPGFDVCIEEVMTTLTSGGCLVPLDNVALQTPSDFFDWVSQRELTMLTLPVSFWEVLVMACDSKSWPETLRLVVFGGDRVNPKLAARWFEIVGNRIALVNAYGPTETTITASHAVLQRDTDITIGRPIDGAKFLVVDSDGSIVQGEGTGELLIGGPGVAVGYWGKPELTAERFVEFGEAGRCYRTGDRVRKREDGNFEFAGRLDDQVKIAGHRIEPSEIAIMMEGHDLIEQAFVNPCTKTGTTKLIGYYVSSAQDQGNDQGTVQDNDVETKLRSHLTGRLPGYMIPAQLIRVNAFPLTQRGKVDRDQLPQPNFDRTPHQESQREHSTQGTDESFHGPTEREVAAIWQNILKLDVGSRDDDFFMIGGDSLMAMRLVMQLKKSFSLRVPIAALIPNPTVKGLAEFIDRELSNGEAVHDSRSTPTITKINYGPDVDASQPPKIVCIHAAGGGGMFYSKLFDSQSIHGPILVLESPYLHGNGPVECHEDSLVEIAKIYTDELLGRYELGDSVILAGYSLGGLLAFEMAQLMSERGINIEKIINVDAPNPQTITRQPLWGRSMRNILKMKQPVTYFKEFVRNRERSHDKREIKRLKDAGLGPEGNQRSLALEMIYCDLIEKYQPGFFEGTMILIRSTQESARFSIPADYGWSAHVKHLDVSRTPGGHLSIFYAPWFNSLRDTFLTSFTSHAGQPID